MKKPIFVHYNDMHLKVGNEEDVLVSIRHMVDYCVNNGIKTLVFGGDFFHSRSNQTENVLATATEILKIINDAGLRHILNVGNHDKTSYFSDTSFMDVYKHHPGVEIYSKPTVVEVEGVSLTIMPFWDDSILVNHIFEAEGADILIGHFEMQGSCHLGHVSEKATITPRTLKKWDKVYLSHYHNTQEITKNIVHLPSLRQNDFGEDANKGFSVIYDDLSYSIVKGCFKEFKKIVLNIDTATPKEIKELIKTHENSDNSIRFELIGDESKLKAIDKNQFKDSGIDVKVKYQKVFNETMPEPKLIQKFDKNKIEEAFKDFCKEKDYNLEDGMELLTKFLKNK